MPSEDIPTTMFDAGALVPGRLALRIWHRPGIPTVPEEFKLPTVDLLAHMSAEGEAARQTRMRATPGHHPLTPGGGESHPCPHGLAHEDQFARGIGRAPRQTEPKLINTNCCETFILTGASGCEFICIIACFTP